jgi:hypothetical protein
MSVGIDTLKIIKEYLNITVNIATMTIKSQHDLGRGYSKHSKINIIYIY